MSDNSIKLKLQTDGFVNVPYPVAVRRMVMESLGLWEKFCSLPKETRRRFQYNEAGGMGVGCEFKETPGAHLDIKENLQFTRGHQAWLETAAVLSDPIAVSLIRSSAELVHFVAPLVLDFARRLETEFDLKGLVQEVDEGQDSWFIRYLHYFGGTTVGEEIAKSHADKSGFTLHLYESDPGLERLDYDLVWRDMPVSEGETVIIPNMQMQVRSRGQLKATWHRVVSTQETAKTGRFSMVAFIPLQHTPAYNKAGGGRLQTFAPGFNYDMPQDEFERLFV